MKRTLLLLAFPVLLAAPLDARMSVDRSAARLIPSCAPACAAPAFDPRTGSLSVTRLDVPGGWYGENLPSGEYAVVVPDRHALATHLGDVPFGPDEPLYVRITNRAGFRIAGQGHTSDLALEWHDGAWRTATRACGVSPVIYDLAGTLHVSDCSIGSQGWRYVADDGSLVTGDATYASGALRLWEYTTHGDIAIGQNAQDDAVAVTPAGRFVLEPGAARFIRFSRDGDRLAIAIAKFVEHRTVLLWLDASDVTAFPREAAPAPPPVVTPPAPPVPTPAPQSGPDAARARAIVAEERAKYPTPMTAAQIVTLLKSVAARLNAEATPGGPYGVLVKTGGTSCDGYSCDIVCAGSGATQRQYDVLGNADPAGSPFAGTQDPGWDGPLHPFAERPCEIVSAAPPPPVVTPPADDPRIAALERQVADLTEKLMTALADRDREAAARRSAEARVSALETQFAAVTAERDAARAEAARNPCERVSVRVVPGWLGAFAGTRCAVKPQ